MALCNSFVTLFKCILLHTTIDNHDYVYDSVFAIYSLFLIVDVSFSFYWLKLIFCLLFQRSNMGARSNRKLLENHRRRVLGLTQERSDLETELDQAMNRLMLEKDKYKVIKGRI